MLKHSVVVVVLLLAACAPTKTPIAPLAVGAPAPRFTLPSAQGEPTTMASGQPMLLAFIAAQPISDAADPSRSQIVFLRSMARQYTHQGLRVMLIETAVEGQPRRAATEDLLNVGYDWGLDTIPLLADTADEQVARDYGVSRLPTTFLVGADGKVAQRWDGFASAGQLALAVQAATQPPIETTNCAPPPAQTPFAGFGPARQITPAIWLIDGGQAWTHGRAQPTTWLIFAATPAPTLVVTLAGGHTPIVHATPEPLPDDEARPLLATAPPGARHVYQLTQALFLPTAGCITLHAAIQSQTITLDQTDLVLDVR